MSLPKPKGWIALLLFICWLLWDNFGKPVWTLNIERWAEQERLDTQLRDGVPDGIGGTLMTWAIQTIDYVTGPFGLGFALGALLFAFWDPLARYGKELFAKHELQLEADLATLRSNKPVEPEPSKEFRIPKTAEALVPVGIWVHGTWHDDGMDIKFTIEIRNRSHRKLYLGRPELDCELGDLKPHGKEPGSKSEIKPSTSKSIWYPPIRIYDPSAKHSGWLIFSIPFGETRGKLDRKMHCGFLVGVDPIKRRPTGATHYRAKASASCMTLEYEPGERPTPISVLASELPIDTEEKKQP